MTIEEAYKLGWVDGYSDGGEQDCRMHEPSADRAWISYRREQISKERGEVAATEYYELAMNKLFRDKEKIKLDNLKCPSCDGEMVSRTNRETKQRFWGCKNYPNCKGTRDTDGLSKADKHKDKIKHNEDMNDD